MGGDPDGLPEAKAQLAGPLPEFLTRWVWAGPDAAFHQVPGCHWGCSEQRSHRPGAAQASDCGRGCRAKREAKSGQRQVLRPEREVFML